MSRTDCTLVFLIALVGWFLVITTVVGTIKGDPVDTTLLLLYLSIRSTREAWCEAHHTPP